MGINVKHLLDRPCSVCEFHKEKGCCKWSCVFEQEREDCISRKAVEEFVAYIQTIKDKHNGEGLSINYGTICDLAIRGWKLVERG